MHPDDSIGDRIVYDNQVPMNAQPAAANERPTEIPAAKVSHCDALSGMSHVWNIFGWPFGWLLSVCVSKCADCGTRTHFIGMVAGCVQLFTRHTCRPHWAPRQTARAPLNASAMSPIPIRLIKKIMTCAVIESIDINGLIAICRNYSVEPTDIMYAAHTRLAGCLPFIGGILHARLESCQRAFGALCGVCDRMTHWKCAPF